MNVNGLRFGFTDEGRGLPLLFVHGFPLGREAWQKQGEALRSSYRIIAPDLRGFGESEGAAGTVTMADYAADLHGLLQQLKAGPVVLIGHSMGGYIALAFARLYQDQLRGLVLVATKAGADTPEIAAGRRAMAEQVRSNGVSTVVAAMAPKMLATDNRDASLAGEVRRLMTAATPRGVIAALHGMAERADSNPVLRGLAVPTLLVAGTEDAIIPPEESEKLAAAIPGAQLCLIPHAGHLVACEAPEAFNQALRKWLASSLGQ